MLEVIITKEELYDKCENVEQLYDRFYCPLLVEYKELKKQLEYLRSGEYLNQLKFERNMLEDLVQNGEISKEDKDFIDMTHRNTELLEQQKDFINYLEDEIEKATTNPYTKLSEYGMNRIHIYKEILQKYKSTIGYKDEQN